MDTNLIDVIVSFQFAKKNSIWTNVLQLLKNSLNTLKVHVIYE